MFGEFAAEMLVDVRTPSCSVKVAKTAIEGTESHIPGDTVCGA